MKALLLSATLAIATITATNLAWANRNQVQTSISAEQAKNLAIDAFGTGVVTDIEFEKKRGRSYYDVEVAIGDGINQQNYDIKIDANTGKIINKHGDDFSKFIAQKNSKISIEQAKNLAINSVGGGMITDVDFESKGGQNYYEIDVEHNQNEYTIKIDAATGKIISKRIDN